MPTEENRLPSIRSLFFMTLEKYITDNIPRHATVLTFSALFAVAPIIVLATKIMGLIYGPQNAERLIRAQVEHFLDSPGVATLVQTLIDNTLPPSASWWIIAGFAIALIYCMSSFFVELKVILNYIWGIPVALDGGIWEFLHARFQGVFMGFIGGLLLFCGLFITTQFTLVTEWLLDTLSLGTGYEDWSYTILLFVMLTTLFALTYQFVPNVRIVWQNVLLGASATAFLFSVSRLLLLQYFNYSYLNTMFGATSAVVIILLWAYYSVSVFLLGAEFTYIYSQTYGRGWREMASSTAESVAMGEPQMPNLKEGDHAIAVTEQNLRLEEIPLSAAFSTPEQIEFLAEFAQQGMPQAIEKKSWLPRIIKREKKSQSNIATDTITTIDPMTTIEEQPKSRFSGIFSRSENKASPTKKSNPITKARQRVRAAYSGIIRILSLPLRVIRPVREIALAIGVIGAISIAAVIGLPLWKKKDRAEDADLVSSE